MNALLTSKDLILSFPSGREIHFDGLSLNKGEFLMVLGPNGSGKTSFLSLFSLPKPYLSYHGELILHFEGKDINLGSRLSPGDTAYYRTRVAYLEQDDSYLWSTSVYDVLVRGSIAKLEAMPKPDRIDANYWKNEKKARKKALKKLVSSLWEELRMKGDEEHRGGLLGDIPVFLNHPRFLPYSSLSGGQKKMVRFYALYLQAKVLGSSLLVLDEPLNDLDKENKKTMSNLLGELLKEEEAPAIICVSHCHIFPYARSKRLEIGEDGHAKFVDLLSIDPSFHPCLGEPVDEKYAIGEGK